MAKQTQTFRSPLQRRFERFRSRLAHADALPQLVIMAVICGMAASAVAIAFRVAIELPLGRLLPGSDSEAFEGLPVLARFFLPLTGALLLTFIYGLFRETDHRLGVSYVIERYQLHQGVLPLRNMALQFIGGVLALITGHSGGREGPAVHLGASSSSLLGQWLKLPNNSLRVLTGCGIAAAIAASFNTPLAGVIFAMEVVMMEYTVIGFIPVIISAVIGSLACRLVYGTSPAFLIPELGRLNLWEIPWLVLCGIAIGLVATGLLVANKKLLHFRNRSLWLRFPVVGLCTGVLGIFVPEILGMGYDTVQHALLAQIDLHWLLVIVLTKLAVFTLTFSLGVPVGGIGPMFVLGACLGCATGILGHSIAPDQASNAGFYAVLGMGGMMAAALNAPLAALVAILELTLDPHTILPSMLVIVVASLTARLFSRLPGLFLIGYDPERFTSPVMQMLNRSGVTSVMTTDIAHHGREVPWKKALEILEAKPAWIVVEDLDAPHFLLPPADLARYLSEQDTALWDEDTIIDLHSIPATRRQLYPIHPWATLQEAWVLMKRENTSAVYVSRPASPLMSDVAGVITREDIESYYQL